MKPKQGCEWDVGSKQQCDVGCMPTQKKVEREITVAFDIFKIGKDWSLLLQQLNSYGKCIQSSH